MIISNTKFSILLLVILFTITCKDNKDTNKDYPVARVFDKYLYFSELKKIIPDKIPTNDSIQIAKEYIDKWIRKQLLLRKAELILSDEEKNLNEQIENYRNSLLIYKYEQYLIHQNLDTTITLEEIKKYYETNLNNFILNDPIVKGLLIEIPSNLKNSDYIKNLVKGDIRTNITKIESFAYMYSTNYQFFGDNWVAFPVITKFIPEEITDYTNFLKRYQYYEITSNDKTIILRIIDYKLPGNIAPIEYVENNIKSIIINKRKLQILNKHSYDIYNEGLKRGYFDIYHFK